jgi:hypothetical protein
MKDEKVQWNARVREPYKKIVGLATKHIGITNECLIEVALASFFGIRHGKIDQYKKKAVEVSNSSIAPLLPTDWD